MTSIPPNFNPETAPLTLNIDWEAYLPFFEDDDIPEDQKQELIEALWSIVVSFVDLGFGVHPVQQVCGQDISLAEMPKADVLNSSNTTSKIAFNKAAAPQSGRQQKGIPK